MTDAQIDSIIKKKLKSISRRFGRDALNRAVESRFWEVDASPAGRPKIYGFRQYHDLIAFMSDRMRANNLSPNAVSQKETYKVAGSSTELFGRTLRRTYSRAKTALLAQRRVLLEEGRP